MQLYTTMMVDFGELFTLLDYPKIPNLTWFQNLISQHFLLFFLLYGKAARLDTCFSPVRLSSVSGSSHQVGGQSTEVSLHITRRNSVTLIKGKVE